MSRESQTGEAPVAGNAILTVSKKTYLTPNYLRIALTGEDVQLFKNCTIGANNKIFIPPPGISEINFPVLDPEARNFIWPDAAVCPVVRTFTHRGIDLIKNELYIDFALHGDKGPASSWAIRSKTGDKLGVAMWINRTEDLYVPAEWYLLAGDATAIPVISVILESLPAEAKGVVYLEVSGPGEVMVLKKPEGIQIEWLNNSIAGTESPLPEKIRTLQIPENVSHFSYIAAENSAVKAIRNYLQKELKWNSIEYRAYSYWKAGVSDDHVQH